MTGPVLQYVVSYRNRKGETNFVTIGYQNSPKGNSDDSFICLAGDDAGLRHISWQQFKDNAADLPPKFTDKVWKMLHPEKSEKPVTVTRKIVGKNTVVTITIEEK